MRALIFVFYVYIMIVTHAFLRIITLKPVMYLVIHCMTKTVIMIKGLSRSLVAKLLVVDNRFKITDMDWSCFIKSYPLK